MMIHTTTTAMISVAINQFMTHRPHRREYLKYGRTAAMDADAGGELVLAEMGEDTPITNHRARDFRYQHAEKSRLGDVQTQGDVFHHWPQALGYDNGSPRRRSSRSGSTRLDSQKDGLPSRSRLSHLVQGSRPSTRAQGGAAWSLPLSIGGAEWTSREHAALCGARCFHLSLCRARDRLRSRRRCPEAPAVTGEEDWGETNGPADAQLS